MALFKGAGCIRSPPFSEVPHVDKQRGGSSAVLCSDPQVVTLSHPVESLVLFLLAFPILFFLDGTAAPGPREANERRS